VRDEKLISHVHCPAITL